MQDYIYVIKHVVLYTGFDLGWGINSLSVRQDIA